MPNRWDGVALLLVMGLLIALVDVGRGTISTSIATIQNSPIHLDPAYLPYYALRSTARMFAALFFSLLFTFTYATLAAKVPPGGHGAHPDPGYSAIRSHSRLPHLHHRVLPRRCFRAR